MTALLIFMTDLGSRKSIYLFFCVLILLRPTNVLKFAKSLFPKFNFLLLRPLSVTADLGVHHIIFSSMLQKLN